MKNVLTGIKKIQDKAESTGGKLRGFLKSSTIADQIVEYEKKIKTFLDHIMVKQFQSDESDALIGAAACGHSG